MTRHKGHDTILKPTASKLLTPLIVLSAVVLALTLTPPNTADGQPDNTPDSPSDDAEDKQAGEKPDTGASTDVETDPGDEPEPPEESPVPAQPDTADSDNRNPDDDLAADDPVGDDPNENTVSQDAQSDDSSGAQVQRTGSKGQRAIVPESAAVGGRYILRSGDMSLRSFTPQETREQVNELFQTLGGYVQSSRGDRFSYRVPSDKLDEAVEGLRQIGEVVDENLRSEDVTMEVATLSAQIAETEESRQRIMGMLEQTNDVSENLAIEEELRTVTQELESDEGRARYLNKRLQMSPIEVVVSMKVRPKVEEPRKSQPFPWVEGYGLSGLLE